MALCGPFIVLGQSSKEGLISSLWNDELPDSLRIDAGKKAIEEFSASFSYFDYFDTKIKLGELYTGNDDTTRGLYFYRSLLRLAQKNDDEEGKADVVNRIGALYLGIGVLDSATYFTERARDAFKKLGAEQEYALCVLNLAVVDYQLANYSLATVQNLEALRIFKKNGDPQYILSGIMSLGLIHLATKNGNKALTCFRNAMRFSKTLKKTPDISKLLNNTGLAHLRMGNFDSALVVLRNVQRKYHSSTLKGSLFHTFVQMAEVHAQLQQNDSALHRFHNARFLQNRVDDKTSVVELWDKLALFHLNQENRDSAQFYAQKALSMADSIGAKAVALKALNTLLSLELSNSGDQAAKEYFRDFERLQEKIFNVENIKAVQNAAVEYQTEQKVKEIANLKEKARLEEELAAKRKQTYVALFIALGLLLTLALLTGFYQLSKRRAKDKLLKERERAFSAEMTTIKKQQELSTFKARVQAQEKERTRISRELHDGIAPALAAAKLNAASQISNDHGLIEALSKITYDLRNLSHDLAPVALDFQSLEESLAHFLSNFDGVNGLLIHLSFPTNGLPNFSPEVQISLYRVVQELMTNIVKHADATEAHFEFELDAEYCSLQVVDNGVGFDAEKQAKGIGLTNVRQRTDEFGGRLTISPNQGIGTQVYVEIPLPT